MVFLHLPSMNAPSTIDVDMTESAGRPPVYHLPPELLAHTFGFLREPETCPISMARTALNVTHVSSWFRSVGIQLQPHLWTRLPLHSTELTELFFPRTARSRIDLIWTERIQWRDLKLEALLAHLLNPLIIPRMRIFELVAPPDDAHTDVTHDSYRRIASRLFRFVLPNPAAVQWTSLERFRIEGLEGDVSVGDEDGEEEGFDLDDDSPWPADYEAALRYLDGNDITSLRSLFPRLTSLKIRDLYPPTMRVIEAIGRYRTQIRSLTLTNLRRVPFHLLADQLRLMENLEYLELRGLSNEERPGSWNGPFVCFSALRKLHITAINQHAVTGVIQVFEMDNADVDIVLPIAGRWSAFEIIGVEDVRFSWTAGQRARYFKPEPFETRIEGPVSENERAELRRMVFHTARELGAYMWTHENVIGLPLDVEMSDEDYYASVNSDVLSEVVSV